MEDKDFRVGDTVCTWQLGDGVVSDSKSEGKVYGVMVEFSSGRVDHFTPEGLAYSGHSRPSLFHGTFEQVFGAVKDSKPKRKVKKFVFLLRDNCLGYHRVEYYPSEDRAVKDYKRMNEADYLTFKAVAIEVEVDE